MLHMQMFLKVEESTFSNVHTEQFL